MTKSSEIATHTGERIKESEKEENPYSLPSHALLLSYLHYHNNVGHPPDLWKAKHTLVDPKAEEEKRLAKSRAAQFNLIAELQNQPAGASSFSQLRYVHDMRKLTRCRLLVGLKRDSCIQLEQQLDLENMAYQEVKNDYKECVNSLEEFLALDHRESMRVLGRAEAELRRTAELSARRDVLSRRYGQLRLDVYHWEEAWRTVRACHRFLHRVSPHDGDEEQISEPKSERSGGGSSSANPATAGGGVGPASSPSMKERAAASSLYSDFAAASSLGSIIASFEKETSWLSKSPSKLPHDLGLHEAADLLKIFRAIELQNLNALIHLESLGGPMTDMIGRINIAEVRVKTEIDDVLESIQHLEAAIERDERQAARLERSSGALVQRCFRALVSSEQALQVRVLVEDAYESCVGPNKANLDSLAMARGLESAYERLSAELDKLPRHLVLACEREGFMREQKETREAEDAARKFALMNRLLGALRRIMEPLQPRHRQPMFRSRPRAATARHQRRRRAERRRGSGTKSAAGGAAAEAAPDDRPSSATRTSGPGHGHRHRHRELFSKICGPKKHSCEIAEEGAGR